MLEYIATTFVGLVAGFVTSIAGGGAGMITIPFFLFIGLPPHTAVATPKFGGLGLTIGSTIRFIKTTHIIWRKVPYLIVLVIAASLVGSNLLLWLPAELIEKIVIVLLLVAIPIMYFNPKVGIEKREPTKYMSVIGYVAYAVVETFRAAFGSVFSMLNTIVLVRLHGLTMLEASATKRIPGILLSLIALLVFINAGAVSLPHGFSLIIGSFTGAYLGTHVAIKKGNNFIKVAFTIVLLVSAIALALGL